MLKYLKKYWALCLLAPLFMLGEITMDLLQPDLMATIVDEGVLKQDMQVILNVGIRMMVLVVFGCFCGIMCGVFANIAANRFANDVRKDLFAKIMSLSFEQTDKISTGSLITRLTNDVTQVQNMITMSTRSLIRVSVMFFGGIIMLYKQSPRFAVVVACGLPFVILFVVFFLCKASPLYNVIQKKLDRINAIMQENIAGARVVKAYVREEKELETFSFANDELCAVNLRVQTLLAFLSPCMNIVLNLCVVGVIYIGGISVKNGSGITPGQIMASITYLSMILGRVLFMANIFQTFTRAGASWNRISEVLKCEKMHKDGDKYPSDDIKGEITFKNVSFAYPDMPEHPVLKNIDFTVKRGETLAIIGATGSGKSSLIHLIPRFFDCTEGEVLVDGLDVREYDKKALRDKIAIVMQKPELYSRPIEANIRWGKPNADPWEIKRAAETAQADDFICSTKNGYYTQVSEGGHSLSGGQKQRITIARALLKDHEVLIFDDSTSALDLKTEAQMYSALEKNYGGVTKIIVAQRIASIKNADCILVLDNGRIIDRGTHTELLEKSDIYRDIYNSQLKGGESRE